MLAISYPKGVWEMVVNSSLYAKWSGNNVGYFGIMTGLVFKTNIVGKEIS